MKCANNLKQYGLAMHSFQTARGYFPPGQLNNPTMQAAQRMRLTGTRDPNDPSKYQSVPRHGTVVFLLPYLEQNDLARQIDLTVPWFHPKNTQKGGPVSQSLSVARCPSVSVSSSMTTGFWQNADANNNSTWDNAPFKMTGYGDSGRADIGNAWGSYRTPAWPGGENGAGAAATDYAPLLGLYPATMTTYFSNSWLLPPPPGSPPGTPPQPP